MSNVEDLFQTFKRGGEQESNDLSNDSGNVFLVWIFLYNTKTTATRTLLTDRSLKSSDFEQKFDCHFSNTAGESVGECDCSRKEELNAEKLAKGEKVHLLWKDKEILKATFDSKEIGTVHEIPVQEVLWCC